MHTKAPVIAAILLVTALAGCASPEPAEPNDAPRPDAVLLQGVVVDQALGPIEGANVTVVGLPVTVQTGARGQFSLELAEGNYALVVTADGFFDRSLQVDTTIDSIRIKMDPLPIDVPWQLSQGFHGFIECGMEAVIISGSCDVLAAYANDATESNGAGRPAPEPLRSLDEWEFSIQPNWQTLVIDVAFDAESHPGLDGLRTVIRGPGDSDNVNEYEQYGRWFNSTSYTIRIEPGGNYTYGDSPVPENQLNFVAQVLPHSHGYHTLCGGGSCFLGAGATQNLEFELLATAFYVDPAPAGWTGLN